MRNKYIAVLTIYITVAAIMTISLRYYQWYISPWHRVPASVWDQIAAQMQVGERPNPLDSAMVLADLDAWLRGTG